VLHLLYSLFLVRVVSVSIVSVTRYMGRAVLLWHLACDRCCYTSLVAWTDNEPFAPYSPKQPHLSASKSLIFALLTRTFVVVVVVVILTSSHRAYFYRCCGMLFLPRWYATSLLHAILLQDSCIDQYGFTLCNFILHLSC
jgi:hypothetical protein